MTLERDPNLPESAYYVPLNRAPHKKRVGKTLEAKVVEKIDPYLELIGMLAIRTNAGMWKVEGGYYIHGAKAGTSDKTCMTPEGGLLVAVETKAPKGGLNKDQKKYRAMILARGGIYIACKSVPELRAALIAAFGAATVDRWEATDWRAVWREDDPS